MDYVGGDVPTESPPYPTDGFWTGLEPATRTTMLRNGLETLAAAAHRSVARARPGVADPAGHRAAVPPRRWRSGVSTRDDELAGREHPLMDIGLEMARGAHAG